MCLHPVTLTRKDPLCGTKTYTVPCGKCAECKSKYRSGIAALCAHQAFVSGSMYFLTLTYDDEHCPIAYTDLTPDGPVIFSYGRNCAVWNQTPCETDKHFLNVPYEHRDSDGEIIGYSCPSLYREDIKNWLKTFRKKYKKICGEDSRLKYIFFGEYGEQRGRPHYHGLVFNLSRDQVELLVSCWRHGDVTLLPDTYRRLDFDEIGKMANYVSKYASKGVCSRFADILPFVEKPRRQSSIDFGEYSQSELNDLRSMMPAMFHHLDGLKSPRYGELLINSTDMFTQSLIP